MTKKLAPFALALCSSTVVWASQPGQPLDCSDWVFLEPGLGCSAQISFPLWAFTGSEFPPNVPIDNEGNLYSLVLEPPADPPACGTAPIRRLSLKRVTGSLPTEVAYQVERCTDPIRGEKDGLDWKGSPIFDEQGGRMLIPMRTWSSGSTTCDPCDVFWLAAITGFTTEFEILQSFAPPPGPIAFRVPVRPEGFPAADWFDTYYGPLTHPIDFTQAQPLRCGYPATPPSPGDYLEVPDSAPALAPGQGYWYVTAVNYGGQRRYGRQNIGGILRGRDPTLLPGCF